MHGKLWSTLSPCSSLLSAILIAWLALITALKDLEAQISELKFKQIAALEKSLEAKKAKVFQLRTENAAQGRETAAKEEALVALAAKLEKSEAEKVDLAEQCRAFAEKVKGKRPLVRADAVWDVLHGSAMEGYLAEYIVAERSTGLALAISHAQHLGAFVEGFDPTASLSLAKDKSCRILPLMPSALAPPLLLMSLLLSLKSTRRKVMLVKKES